MSNLKMAALLSVMLLIGLICAPAAAQEEETEVKAKDTPYFSAMPDYEIYDANDKKFDAYRFFNGKDATTVEGKKFFRQYTLKEGAEAASEIQISRNFANAIKNMGGMILFDGVCEGEYGGDYSGYRMVVGNVVKGASELWVEVAPYDDGLGYYLTVVVKESMTQDVTAGALLDALNKEGRVALYINFDTGKATIRPDSKPIIDQIVQMMKANGGLELSVEGHTDNVGDSKSNQALSENRAKAVAAAIIMQGIEAKRLGTAGYGQDKPVADNSTEEGRAKNRRVELVKRGRIP
jgi:OOP family OmpA-OmpF porin